MLATSALKASFVGAKIVQAASAGMVKPAACVYGVYNERQRTTAAKDGVRTGCCQLSRCVTGLSCGIVNCPAGAQA